MPIRIKFGKGTKSTLVFHAQLLDCERDVFDAKSGCIISEPVASKSVLKVVYTNAGSLQYEIEFVGTEQKLSGSLAIY